MRFGNLALRSQMRLFKWLQDLGVSVIAYQPLASGKLTQRQLERGEQGSEVRSMKQRRWSLGTSNERRNTSRNTNRNGCRNRREGLKIRTGGFQPCLQFYQFLSALSIDWCRERAPLCYMETRVVTLQQNLALKTATILSKRAAHRA